jgi:DNA ligase-1
MAKFPAGIRAYDLLLDGATICAAAVSPNAQAAGRLSSSALKQSRIDLSPLQPFSSWDELALRAASAGGRCAAAEGLMLKRWDSIYEAGRPKAPGSNGSAIRI